MKRLYTIFIAIINIIYIILEFVIENNIIYVFLLFKCNFIIYIYNSLS